MSGTRASAAAVKRTRNADVGTQAREKQEPRLASALPISDHRSIRDILRQLNDRLQRLRRRLTAVERGLEVAQNDFGTEVGRGNIVGYSKVNKFGEALDCDSGAATDVWDGADGTTSTDVWVAPTQARTHDLASTSAADAAAGTGMRTCRVYGLTGWDADEVSEDVTLNGASNVATANAYVIIHRIKGLTWGSGGTNAGIITATAQTDVTVTAAIQAGESQTLMCIYGVPSTKEIHLQHIKCTVIASGPSATADGRLLVRENADQSDSAFVTKEKFSITELLEFDHEWGGVGKSFSGPCVVKVQVVSDTNNTEVTSDFDAYLTDA